MDDTPKAFKLLMQKTAYIDQQRLDKGNKKKNKFKGNKIIEYENKNEKGKNNDINQKHHESRQNQKPPQVSAQLFSEPLRAKRKE